PPRQAVADLGRAARQRTGTDPGGRSGLAGQGICPTAGRAVATWTPSRGADTATLTPRTRHAADPDPGASLDAGRQPAPEISVTYQNSRPTRRLVWHPRGWDRMSHPDAPRHALGAAS